MELVKKFTPLTVVMKGKFSYIDQNHFLYQAVKIFFFCYKLGHFTWGVYGIDSFLEPASSSQSMNCSFSHFLVKPTRFYEREREVAAWYLHKHLFNTVYSGNPIKK